MVHAVQNVSFTVKQGEVVGLLGENGAGKTTLLRMISTILEPTSGKILFDKQEINQYSMDIKRKIGVLFESETGLYERLTARENLVYIVKLYQISDLKTKTGIDKSTKRCGMND